MTAINDAGDTNSDEKSIVTARVSSQARQYILDAMNVEGKSMDQVIEHALQVAEYFRSLMTKDARLIWQERPGSLKYIHPPTL